MQLLVPSCTYVQLGPGLAPYQRCTEDQSSFDVWDIAAGLSLWGEKTALGRSERGVHPQDPGCIPRAGWKTPSATLTATVSIILILHPFEGFMYVYVVQSP